jgi:hypothetical protein
MLGAEATGTVYNEFRKVYRSRCGSGMRCESVEIAITRGHFPEKREGRRGVLPIEA